MLKYNLRLQFLAQVNISFSPSEIFCFTKILSSYHRRVYKRFIWQESVMLRVEIRMKIGNDTMFDQ